MPQLTMGEIDRKTATTREVGDLGAITTPTPRARPPDAPSNDRRPLGWWQTALVAATVGAVLLFRWPDQLLRPQFWCEDGLIFFWQAWRFGWRALFEPYEGYFHTVPRLFALLGSFLPVRWMPALDNWGAWGVTVALAVLVCRYCRVEHGLRAGLALAPVLVPHGGELYVNQAGLQWFFAPVEVLLLLQRPAETWRQGWMDAALLLLLGMTGPFLCFFLVPLGVVRLLLHRRISWKDFPAFMVCLLAAGIQGASILRGGRAMVKPLLQEVPAWLKQVGFELPGRLFFGNTLPELMGTAFWIITPVLVGLCIWMLAASRRDRRWLALGFLLCGAVIYVAALRMFQHDPRMQPFGSGSRYFFIPYVMGAWALVIFSVEPRWASRQIAQVLLGMMLLASASRFQAWRPPNYHWPETAARIERGDPTVITQPNGWTFKLEPKTPPVHAP